VDGSYGDTFFGDPKSDQGYSRRLRAVIQNLQLDFADAMRSRGHRREFVNVQYEVTQHLVGPGIQPEYMSRAEFLKHISMLLKRTRGRELPGMYNPLIIGDLFFEHAEPWKKLAENHLKIVWEASRAFLDMVISHLTDEDTAEALLDITGPRMEQIWIQLESKLYELLLPYLKGHPITYNHYFTETIQNMRNRRLEEELARRLSNFFHAQQATSLEELPNRKVKTANLVAALAQRNEADMDLYASSEILDCMLAFYKVRL
jgi:hypothetical protein